jgi:transcriptional regulator with XRE-family HTH domain
MNLTESLKPNPPNAPSYLSRLREMHECSGLSLRDVAQAADLDPTYVHYILKGARRPRRDVIIALGFAYSLDREEVDEILLLTGYPPLGRSILRSFHQDNNKVR